MNLGDVVGQFMRDGLSPQTHARIEHAAGDHGLGGADPAGGLGDLFGSLLGGQQGSQGAGGLGDMLGGIGEMLGADSGVGGMSRGQVGGIGALAGALLGGGGGATRGAIGGSAMAVLGTIALSALKNWQSGSAEPSGSQPAAFSDTELQRIAAPDTAELCLLGMIEAIKSDGQISAKEFQRIVGSLEEGGITADEKQFVEREMRKPSDVGGLVARIPDRQVGAQVYAAALMAITVDTRAERAFLQDLANGVGLDRDSVARLHKIVGAPAV